MKREGSRARFMLRLMQAATNTTNAVLAPLLLIGAVAAGVITGSGDAFQAALALGAAGWLLSVLNSARARRPGEPEDVFAAREQILLEINTGLDEAARRLIQQADAVARRGRRFRPSAESGYDATDWETRRGQLARIYDLAGAVDREYRQHGDPSDGAALIALPELPRQVESAVNLSRRRVAVLQSLYSANHDEIAERLARAESEAAETAIGDRLRDVRQGRTTIVRRELETYRRLLEERETIDALLDSIESFLRRLSFRGISVDEVQGQIAEIDGSLEAHDQAMEEFRQELRRASGAAE